MNVKKPAVLLFHTTGRENEVLLIQGICIQQNITVKVIEPSAENAPLGLLAEASGWQNHQQSTPAPLPLKEMMLVLCGLDEEQMDGLLGALRFAGLRNILKASLTEYNAVWNACSLYGEISSEREYLMGKKK